MSSATGFSDDRLRDADRIILVDPNRPGWCMPLRVRMMTLKGTGTIEIPVDSKNRNELRQWRERIAGLGD